ncbi:DNA/RNA non-specific endonuclease [Phyllobacterium sp. UNC302MFCol5.2]|uniref:DNA/RNA non-specific endonuclease n=1 Tax=Phyllobacterium sp. UNC302MFCol5.2 TaxID=1449065 RepID=UPI0004859833|nr:DNA/RNA non-specific endonuclease [Phyllobacterium sp. UNC302MFCol5.2]
MGNTDADRLKDYLTLITRKHGGIEPIRNMLEERTKAGGDSGLESMPGDTDETRLAKSGLEAIELGRDPSKGELYGLEAIILPDLRPAIDIVDNTFTVTHPLWRRLSDDAAIRTRIEGVIPSIGRIELPGNNKYPYGGTGFVVGDGLLMTNRHVAEIFSKGLGDRRLAFIDGARAAIDFKREQGRPTGPMLDVVRVVMIHPYWDMAILAVNGLPATAKPLKLSLSDARDLTGHDIFAIGYPAFDPRNPSDVQNDVMAGRYGVKRLQPGELQGGITTSSFGKMVPAATHDCSTLGGNSGSAILDLDSGEVMGLHFGGLYQKQNYAVPAYELSRDSRVIAAGVQFAGAPTGGANDWGDWWQRADGAELVANGGDPTISSTGNTASSATAHAASSITIKQEREVGRIVLPLRITISVDLDDQKAVVVASESVSADDAGMTESARAPFRDTDFSTRKGYDAHFLNDPSQEALLAPVEVAMPQAADASVLARTLTGSDTLHYENFSIRMHAQRRLALITASNVTKAPELKRPEPGRDYTRRGLSGLGESDQELWFTDPRLDEALQIPDVFFTRDRKAFDKGHIVRRDDVAWGATYDQLRRANGDTYHVTNCSPHVAGFNRAASGHENWGDLENCVLAEAANERLCVFAGPVLDPSDEVFTGVGEGRTVLRAKIPSRYWKVITSRVADGIAAYGFMLEQDLADVDFEFAVPAEFVPAMYPIADIERLAGVRFDEQVRKADQYETVRGTEVGLHAGSRRKKMAAGGPAQPARTQK